MENPVSSRTMIVIAHNIRSMYNVGSIFRNVAAFDVEKLYLTGITAIPPRKEIAKVALGAEELVDWESGEINKIIANLKANRFSVYGLEQGKGSKCLNEIRDKKIAIVLGNEVEGIDDETMSRLDGLIEIAMGKKRSLNVAVASGVAMFVLSGK